jgi:hypothetical protein
MQKLVLFFIMFKTLFCYSQKSNFIHEKKDFNKITISKDAKIKKEPNANSDVIYYVTTDSQVEFIDFYSDYWNVKLDTIYGYVSDLWVVNSPYVIKVKESVSNDKQFLRESVKKQNLIDFEIQRKNLQLSIIIDSLNELKNELKDETLKLRFQNFETLPMAKQWDLLTEFGGCLVGGQYCSNGTCGGEGCVLTKNKYWLYFLNSVSQSKIDFLINRMGDTTDTNLHTCPFYSTKQGEIAVYSLQFIFKINWYDFSIEYLELIENSDDSISVQEILWEILSTDDKLKKLKGYWLSLK